MNGLSEQIETNKCSSQTLHSHVTTLGVHMIRLSFWRIRITGDATTSFHSTIDSPEDKRLLDCLWRNFGLWRNFCEVMSNDSVRYAVTPE